MPATTPLVFRPDSYTPSQPGVLVGDLFADTAWHYARFGPGYPRELFDEIVATFRLDSNGRLLDLGCGTGQLAVPLAAYVSEAVGADPSARCWSSQGTWSLGVILLAVEGFSFFMI
ncbi:methyltransferase domain-containing protein [Nocardia sp. SYP-A9097]|uniref:methyltransferase domain-containing protein n=1 Tax=Nocardia sp. SYP-A9097 TaxID=2663237 RepID=UPI00129A80A2|nr:methyltransferase domain-containing protein [Nocardia sp. SYP-A9097]MRH87646.1 methyltransferase domain-containing protein [Nocardia sp. SYP-A9097]